VGERGASRRFFCSLCEVRRAVVVLAALGRLGSKVEAEISEGRGGGWDEERSGSSSRSDFGGGGIVKEGPSPR
jgi:hypothetical protein